MFNVREAGLIYLEYLFINYKILKTDTQNSKNTKGHTMKGNSPSHLCPPVPQTLFMETAIHITINCIRLIKYYIHI